MASIEELKALTIEELVVDELRHDDHPARMRRVLAWLEMGRDQGAERASLHALGRVASHALGHPPTPPLTAAEEEHLHELLDGELLRELWVTADHADLAEGAARLYPRHLVLSFLAVREVLPQQTRPATARDSAGADHAVVSFRPAFREDRLFGDLRFAIHLRPGWGHEPHADSLTIDGLFEEPLVIRVDGAA